MTDLDALAARLISGASPGCSPPAGAVVGVARGGRACVGVAGDRSLPPTTASSMTRDTSHDIASVTKVVATTTALIRLVSDGCVGLDDAVHRHLPRFRGGAKDTVTLRDLLLHRGGLWEWQPLYVAVAARDSVDGRSPDDVAAAAHRYVDELPLRDEPHRARRYSDLGFIQLGRVVASVIGTSLADAVGELVTEPLGLIATRFARPVSGPVATSAWSDGIERTMVDTGTPYPTPFRADEFGAWRADPIAGDVCDGNAFHAFGGVSGHAGLFSTVDDLLRWGTALSSFEGRDDLWRPDAAATFFEAGPDRDQALGFRRYEIDRVGAPLTVVGHPGFVGCAAGFVPGGDVAVAMATNRLLTDATPMPTEALWRAVLDTVLADAGGPDAEAPT